MKGKELLQFLGYSVDHPDFKAFLAAHHIDLQHLPDPLLPEKKVRKYLHSRFIQGFALSFDFDDPARAAALSKSDPEGRSIFSPADYRIKNPVGNGPLYLTRIDFFTPEASATDPVQLPFGLQLQSNGRTVAGKLGTENPHGPANSQYYEADEKDFYYERYHVYVYFDRGDREERLQQLTVMLR